MVLDAPDRSFEQSGLRSPDEVLLLPQVERVRLDRERAPQNVEQGRENFFASFRRAGSQRRRRFQRIAVGRKARRPQLFFFEQAVLPGHAVVLEAEQSAILEIGGGDPPASLKVAVQEVFDRLAKRRLGVAPGRPANFRIRRVILEPEVERLERMSREAAMFQRAFPRRGLVQRRAQKGDLGEVVEMPGLQRGVLPVVGEAQQLSRFGRQRVLALQFDEGANREDRRRRASVVDAQRAQLGLLRTLVAGVRHPAGRLQAKQEVAGNERRRNAVPFGDDAARGVDEDRLGNVPAGIGSNPLAALGRRFPHEGGKPRKPLLFAGGPWILFGNVEPGVSLPVFAAVFARFEDPVVPAPRNPVIRGAALPAEHQRKERLVRFARLGAELGDLYVAARFRLDGRPDGVAAREELVQAKREYRETARLVGAKLRAPQQITAQRGRAPLRGDRRKLRQLLGRPAVSEHGARRPPNETARLPSNPEGRLDPRRQRVFAERLPGFGRVSLDRQCVRRRRQFGRRAFQSFSDHRPDGSAEQRLRDRRHLLFGGRPAARHRRGRAHADHAVAVEGEAASANQQGDVRALPPAIGMELVQDQEPQALGGPHQFAILAPREQQFEHHVVGEQDVRRVGPDLFPFRPLFLTRVAREPHRRAALAEKFREFLVLAVGQRVHRVDDDRPDPFPGAAPKDMVHDRHDIGQALARSGAARQNVRLAFSRLPDRFRLMSVQRQFLAVAVRLVQPENAGAFLVQNAFRNQIVDRAPGLEGRIELEKRLRPEGPGLQFRVDFGADAPVGDPDEAPRVPRVVSHEVIAKSEYVH